MNAIRRRRSGTPTEGGKASMQRAHRPDYMLVMLVGLIMLLGMVMMYAIGPQRAQILNALTGSQFSETYFVVKQGVSLLLALVALVAMAIVPLSYIKKHAGKIILLGLGASAALFLFGNLLHVDSIAMPTLGAYRWFNLGSFGGFQPAELLKFGVLIFLARFLASQMKKGLINDWEETLIPALLVSGAALFIIVIVQKDLGTGLSLTAIIMSLLMVAGLKARIGFILMAALAAVGILAVVSAPHRMARMATFLQGDSASSEASGNYHIHHAKIAIGSGGLMGVGIGNSVQATGYLPEAINDSVFAIMGETFGFVGLMAVLILFTALLLRILRISDRIQDEWMKLLVAGVFGWLAAHIILNIASMIGLAPLTGITLPLLSFGGTSMLFIAAALGMVFQASRYTVHESLIRKDAYANLDRGRGIGRTRYAGRRRTA